jgi:hypothetical protein
MKASGVSGINGILKALLLCILCFILPFYPLHRIEALVGGLVQISRLEDRKRCRKIKNQLPGQECTAMHPIVLNILLLLVFLDLYPR